MHRENQHQGEKVVLDTFKASLKHPELWTPHRLIYNPKMERIWHDYTTHQDIMFIQMNL